MHSNGAYRGISPNVREGSVMIRPKPSLTVGLVPRLCGSNTLTEHSSGHLLFGPLPNLLSTESADAV